MDFGTPPFASSIRENPERQSEEAWERYLPRPGRFFPVLTAASGDEESKADGLWSHPICVFTQRRARATVGGSVRAAPFHGGAFLPGLATPALGQRHANPDGFCGKACGRREAT
jgi:hypothetical protein